MKKSRGELSLGQCRGRWVEERLGWASSGGWRGALGETQNRRVWHSRGLKIALPGQRPGIYGDTVVKSWIWEGEWVFMRSRVSPGSKFQREESQCPV